MKIYFAGIESSQWLKAIIQSKGTKSLFSYYYLNKNNNSDDLLETSFENKHNIFLDSGAFSAYTKNVTIDIYEYCDFIYKYIDKITTYASLDVIKNPEETLKNYKLMKDKGLNPLITFHKGSSIGYLKEMVNENDYIAVGGMAGQKGSTLQKTKFLDKCFSIIKSDCKVHGFGYTSIKGLQRYPFYSVDSTNWLSGSQRAQVYKYENGNLKGYSTNDKNKINSMSVNYKDYNNKRWYDRVVNNAVEWQKFETYVTQLWQKRGISWNE